MTDRPRRGRPPRSPATVSAERGAILAAARAVVAERGPGASIEDIARAAGVRKPAIYEHFEDKAGLAEALAATVTAEVAMQVLRRAGPGDPDAALRAGLDAFTRFMADETSLYRFVVHAVRARPTDVLDTSLVPLYLDLVEAYVRERRPDVPAAVRSIAAHGFVGQVFTAGEAWLAQPRRLARTRLVDTLVALVRAGVDAL